MMRTHRAKRPGAFHEPVSSPNRFVVHGNGADAVSILCVLPANVQDPAIEIDVAKPNAAHLAIRC